MMTLTGNSWPEDYYVDTRTPDDLEEYGLKYGNNYPTKSARRSLMRHGNKPHNKRLMILTLMRQPV